VGAVLQLDEYLDNLRALLRADPNRWRLVVERQVLARVLPQLRGPQASLEAGLWQLLLLCLDGHEAVTPPLEAALLERAAQAATTGRTLAGTGPAVYPRAGAAVAKALLQLREHGIFPPPKVSS
jgi:hypothetical protein